MAKEKIARKACIAAVAVCLAGSLFSADALCLAERGTKGAYGIVGMENGPSFKYAAEELSKYVCLLTGVEMPFAKGEVGTVYLEKGVEALGEDGFRLWVDGKDLHVSGGKRGVLYGVYELLETYGGCGWYSSWHEVVPKRSTFEVPADLDVSQVPTFLLRMPSWSDVKRNVDFAVRLRMNGDSAKPQEKHGGAACRFVDKLPRWHTFNVFLPASKYFKDHPEWYSEIGGVRRGGAKTQICLTNPEALEQSVKNICELIDRDPHGARIVGVSQNDCPSRCQCKRCAAIEAREESGAGPLLHFVNAVAERLERRYPGIIVESLLYQYSRKPPKHMKPRANVMPCFCVYEAEFAHPLETSKYIENVNMVRDLRRWGELSRNLLIWDYSTNWRFYQQPMATVTSIQPNFRFFRNNGAKYLYVEGGDGWHADLAELRAWLIAKLSWNPDQDVNRLLDQFFKGYYGEAAPFVRTYYEELHAAFRAHPDKVLTIWHRDQRSVLDGAFERRMTDVFAKACAAVADDPAYLYNVRGTEFSVNAWRLNRMSDDVKIAWATRTPGRFSAPEGARELYEKVSAFVDESARLGRCVRFNDGLDNASRLAIWKTSQEFARPSSGSDVAIVGMDKLHFTPNQDIKIVKDRTSLQGTAYLFPNVTQSRVKAFHVGNLAYDPGVRYRVWAHVRVDRTPGGKGEAFGGQFFHGFTGEVPIRFSRRVEDMPDGWEWYDCGACALKDDYELLFGAGRFDNGGGSGAVQAMYVDAFKFSRCGDCQ